MPNHQLANAKYHFCDSFNERLMFRSQTKIVEKSLFETANVNFLSRKVNISQEPIDDLASKKIFFFAFFAILDQF